MWKKGLSITVPSLSVLHCLNNIPGVITKFGRKFFSQKLRPVFFVSIFKSRVCKVSYCVRVLKTSWRWGQVGEQHGVIYDIKSHVVSLYYYYLFAFYVLIPSLSQ